MKKISKFTTLLLVLSLLLPYIALAAEQPSVSSVLPGHAYIPKNTLLSAELVSSVDSGKNKEGDIVLFKTTEQLVIDGVVVIPKDTTGEAIVSHVKKAGSWGKGGKIELTAKSIKTINNIEVPLTLETDKAGGGQKMLVPILLIGVFSGFVRGKNQQIPAGTKFQIAVANNTDLQLTATEFKRLAMVK